MSITTLSIDAGIQEFQINNGGVLRFNPSDPNVYNRFFGVINSIDEVDRALA